MFFFELLQYVFIGEICKPYVTGRPILLPPIIFQGGGSMNVPNTNLDEFCNLYHFDVDTMLDAEQMKKRIAIYKNAIED